MKRRQFVKGGLGIVSIATTTIAGCSGSSDDSEVTDSGNANGGDSSSGSTDSKSDKSDDSGGKSNKKLKLINHEFYEEEYSAGVKGEVKNISGKQLGYVGVQIKFLDGEGTRIGEGLANTTELPAGSKWAFDAPALVSEPDKIEDYKIEVGTTPFS